MKIISFIILFAYSFLYSVDYNLEISALSNGTAGLYSISKSVSDSYYNPSFSFSGIETSYTELYSLKELSYGGLYLGKKFKRFAFSSGILFLNNSVYKKGEYILSVSKNILNLNVGVSARILYISMENDYCHTAFVLDAGFNKNFDKLSVDFSIKNITNTKIDGEKISNFFLWNINYLFTKSFTIGFGIEKQTDYDFIYKIATYYKLNKYLHIFSGYKINPDRLGGGFIVFLKKISFSYGFQTHSELPITHYFTIGYAL